MLNRASSKLILRPPNHTSLKLNQHCRPHNLKKADPQKGLMLTLGDEELIQEDLGFGALVKSCDDEASFSTPVQVFTYEEEESNYTLKPETPSFSDTPKIRG